ncbi:MAG: 3-oxoacid CoA-transferase subunit A [Clostridiales bacterium]|nr:3-oxoacid CoA-transferase subunit A [Clostridiales bacterium]
MVNKFLTADEAVAGVKDGMTIMVGGFLGTGSPEILMDALVRKGVKHLTVIGNDAGLPEGTYGAKTARGIAKLVEAGMVDHIIASHVGMNPMIAEGMNAGTLKCTLVPQGTLAEKIRAANYGLGGVLTPTGVGTPVQDAEDELGRKKQVLTIDGKEYLLELPLKADYAFVRASVCDKFGNFKCAKATKNFNYVMAGAADQVVVASERVAEVGELDADDYDIPGVVVDIIVEGEAKWQI